MSTFSFVIPPSQVQSNGNNAFSILLPDYVDSGDTPEAPTKSLLALFEDGRLIGPAHQIHQLIMTHGRGAYSHWGRSLIFSSSDNSDPRVNSRNYSVKKLTPSEMQHITLDNFENYFYPKIVGIETINACNARCPFCPLFRGDTPMLRESRPPTIMTDELFELCVEEIASWPMKPTTIFLNMNGEPLQDPKIANRLSAIKKTGLGNLVCIQTNGQFLDENVAAAILDAEIGELAIGFDGATKETYESHRVRCDYSRVLNNIRQLSEIRTRSGSSTRITIKFVRTRKNDKEIVQAYNLFADFLSPELDKFEDSLSVDWGDAGDSDPLYYVGKVEKGKAPKGCNLYNDQLIVLADGLLAACCWDYNLSVSSGGFGNVLESGLIKAWRSENRVQLLKKLFSGDVNGLPVKCQNCPNLFEATYSANEKPAFTDERAIKAAFGFTYRFRK